MKKINYLYTYWLLFAIFVGSTSYLRFLYVSPYARSWDQVDFVLAVTDFDLYQMQPHFPGYPYFVLGGIAFHYFVKDPVQALSVFNMFMACTSIVPIYLLLKRYVETRANLLLTAAIYSMSYIWVMNTEPMSEAAAVAVVWWFLWSLHRARTDPSFFMAVVPLLFFSILMGIRLSYLPFGVGILLLWIYYRRHFNDWSSYLWFLVQQGIIAVLLQLIWVIGLIISTGGVTTFLELASGFVAGHFTEWGGAVTVDSDPLIERFFDLIVYNFFWTGMFAQSLLIAILYILFMGLFIWQWKRQKLTLDPFTWWLLVLWISYFLWALFAQNVDKPRHILPLTGLFSFLLLKGVFQDGLIRKKTVIGLCIALIASQTVVGINLIREKAEEPPAVYQLTEYLAEIDEPMLVFTWEESRVMEYMQVSYSHIKIYTYAYFELELPSDKKTRVFLTDQVVEGFENQGYDIQSKVKKIAAFHSNVMFDPVYSDIILYEWVGKDSD